METSIISTISHWYGIISYGIHFQTRLFSPAVLQPCGIFIFHLCKISKQSSFCLISISIFTSCFNSSVTVCLRTAKWYNKVKASAGNVPKSLHGVVVCKECRFWRKNGIRIQLQDWSRCQIPDWNGAVLVARQQITASTAEQCTTPYKLRLYYM